MYLFYQCKFDFQESEKKTTSIMSKLIGISWKNNEETKVGKILIRLKIIISSEFKVIYSIKQFDNYYKYCMCTTK